MDAFLGGESGHAYMLFRVGKDMEKAAEAALSKKGIQLVTQDDVAKM